MAPALLLACAPATDGWLLTARGKVIDLRGEPVAAEVSVHSDGALLGEVAADADGTWSLSIVVEEDAAVPLRIAAQDGEALGTAWSTLEVYEQPTSSPLFVGSGQRLDSEVVWVPAVVVAEPLEDSLSGRVLDGSSGEAASRVLLEVRSGWNAPSSEPVLATTATDVDGLFEASLPAGVYTLHAQADEGWAASVFPAATGGDALGVVVPPLAEDQLVMALTHEGTLDLDLHTVGPRAGTDGTGQPFDVYSERPDHPDRGDPVAELVVEEHRVEVGWVHERRTSGLYRAVVFDAGGLTVEDNDALGHARPAVQFWSSEGPAMAQATPGRIGTHWVALRLDLDREELQRPESYGQDADPTDPMTF